MIKCSSTIKMNSQIIDSILDASQIALLYTAEEVHTQIVQEQVVPRRTGNLQNESMFIDDSLIDEGKVSIIHTAPYARRLYFHPEYNFNRDSWTERIYGKRGRYAKNGREYKGKIKRHDGNANAKGKWLEDWAEPPEGTGKYVDKIKKTYADFFRSVSKL